jgi:ferrochelatase
MSENIKNKDEKKVAIVLFNLGGPDKLESVRPFLFNLFSDKNIINLPRFFRYIIAWIIAWRREKVAKKIYDLIGGKSPILEETLLQKESLSKTLRQKIPNKFEVFICMRHWHPMAEEVVGQIKNYNPDEIILLPLYPQFSTTTTASAIEEFMLYAKKYGIKERVIKTVCCYPNDEKFINAHVKLIEETIDNLTPKSNYRILFSAHGLPKKIIDNGDPYQWQVETTVRNIIEQLSYAVDYKITYQSKVGPLEWIGPNTEEEIMIAAKSSKNLIIVPIAFVSEHVETMVELDIEYKKIADQYAIQYLRVPTLRINEIFIEFLANMIIDLIKQKNSLVSSSIFEKICPVRFDKCPCTTYFKD